MTFYTESEQRHDGQHDSYTFSIDSRHRDIFQYPNPNDYAIALPAECRNIRRVELRSVGFTNTQYVVTESNNVVVITRTDSGIPQTTTTVVFIKNGSYTGASLASQLTLQLAAAQPTGGALSVTYDADTGQLGFRTTGATVVDVLNIATSQDIGHANFTPNLMWDVLGLGQRTADFTIPNSTTATPNSGEREYGGEQINITPDRHIVMVISHPQIMQGRMRTTGNHHQSFANIIFNTDKTTRFDGFIQSRSTDFVAEPVTFRYIMRLDRMHFKFYRPNGDPYDFHHHDHSFTLRITTK